MKPKKFIHYFAAVCAGAIAVCDVQATPLTPGEALARVSQDAGKRMASFNKNSMMLTHTVRSASGKEAEVYVFGKARSGYIVVSADDCAPALLGYGDSNITPGAALPPSMTYWLNEYARQIAAMRAAGISPKPTADETAPNDDREAIAPMVTTKWGQDAPYNAMCPMDGDYRSVSGCVATAMAQVMNYHKWPERGTGSHSYILNPGTEGAQSVGCDFSAIAFDWDNMPDIYAGGYSDKEATAVAQLMYACGVSVDMVYRSTASSAYSDDAARAFPTYFGYDKGVAILFREFYGSSEWEDIVYRQLQDYGPVLYGGVSTVGGHEFVCDGYDTDGYFHFNWGWDGISDGYFLLNALSPTSQGIGGTLDAFNYGQDIIVNITRPRPGSDYTFNMLLNGDFGIAQTEANTGDRIEIGSPREQESFYNFCMAGVSGTAGLKITPAPATGGEAFHTAEGTNFDNIGFSESFRSYECVIPDDIADGTYILTPAFKDERGEWHDIRVKNNRIQQVQMTVTGGVCRMTEGNRVTLTADNVRLESEIYPGNQFTLKATATNPAAKGYEGAVCPVLVDNSGEMLAYGSFLSLSIQGGATEEITYLGELYPVTESGEWPAAGSYLLCIADYDTGEACSEMIPVTVNAAPEASEVSISDFAVTAPDPEHVADGKVEFTANVKCEEGYFGGRLIAYIFGPDPADEEYLAITHRIATSPVFVKEGETAGISMSAELEGSDEGTYYLIAIYDNEMNELASTDCTVYTAGAGIDTCEKDTPTFIVSGTTGIVTGAEKADVAIYSPDGVRRIAAKGVTSVDLSRLGAGIYIVTLRTADGYATATRIHIR